jgi:uncharacterized protein (DUF305 family)
VLTLRFLPTHLSPRRYVVILVVSLSAFVVSAPLAAQSYTNTDVHFMQGMIAHHAQALAMAELVPARTSRDDMKLLARRIFVSQTDEIKMMRRWLTDRHQVVPVIDPEYRTQMPMDSAHEMAMAIVMDSAHTMTMPGMLTPPQMKELSASKGPEFDRLFLVDMIQHHAGAITMVANLFHTKGAGQESQTFRFASDVDTDQRAEIARMQYLLSQPLP